IGKIYYQDTEHDIELEGCDQSPPALCRRDLGDKHGRRHRRGTDTHSAEKAEEHKRNYFWRERRAQRGDKEYQPDPYQHFFPAEALGGNASEQGTDNGAI